MTYDFLIVGGGPAGSVTGMRLAQAGARVAIVEGSSYDGDRFGETLPPEINPVLRDLGLWDAFQEQSPARAPGIVSAWSSDAAVEQDFVRNPHGGGWRVDRNAFDSMLLEQARRAGAETRTGVHLATPERSAGLWRAGEFAARFLIDATGRNGLGLSDRGEREFDDVLLAVALRIAFEGAPPRDGRTLIETTPGGWWYSGLLPGGKVIAMFFTDPETYSREGVDAGERLMAAPFTRERLGGGCIESSRVVYVPSSCRKTVAGDGWLAVGDAAASYDPLSGRGVFKALRHGAAAADACLHGAREIAGYAQTVRGEFDSYVRQRRAYYAAERRWAHAGFWRRRAAVGQ